MSALKHVSPKQLHEWLKNKQAVVIDVREKYEYDAKHIPGSKLVSIGLIRDHKLQVPKDKKVVVHCQLGKRGSMACEILTHTHPELDIYNLEGGLVAWEREGFDVEE